MIRITHLYKRYGDRIVLNDVSLTFPRNGIVVIHGPSGCGKTTLLNCIGGLLDFEGSIYSDSVRLEGMSEKERSLFRLRTYGFVFQDFKLFENETIGQNILFPLETLTHMKKEKKLRKVTDLLSIVNLQNINTKTYVSHLSGGEKQRVAIARALANDPKVILADEPTGALDVKNSREVMEILEKISSRSLVLLVSHDRELSEKYADYIVEMKDGKVVGQKAMSKHQRETSLPVLRNSSPSRTPSVPFRFLFRHSAFALRKRKWRTLFCNMVTSLGLIGVGLSIVLTSSISENITSAYSSLVDSANVIVSMKEDVTLSGLSAGSYYEAKSLKEKYPDLIHDVGFSYLAGFESFFPERNCIALADTAQYSPLYGLSARHINEYQWLDLFPSLSFYPSRPESLADDEVCASLTIDMIRSICYYLQIERTVTSLSNYIRDHGGVKFYFDLENDSWSYSDQEMLLLRAFSLSGENGLFHYRHDWNEYMFEERMCFPTDDVISRADYYPWTMKKIPYLEVTDFTEEVLSLSHSDAEFDPYLLEIAGTDYYPWLYLDRSPEERHRLLFYANTLNYIPIRHVTYFQDAAPDLSNPVFGSYGGYAIYPESLLMGFSRSLYFSASEDLLDSTVDILTTLNGSGNDETELPKGILEGYYAKSSRNGVTFRPSGESFLFGKKPQNLSEIAVSSSMASALFGYTDVTGQTLHLAYNESEKYLPDGRVKRTFLSQTLRITGVVESSDYRVYHDPEWTVSYFQAHLGVSVFDLGVTNIAFEVKDNGKIAKTLELLNRAFPSYSAVNPLADIAASVGEMCGYIRIALLAFSVLAVIISVLLLTICNYLHALENRREIGLSRCIGITPRESRKFLLSHSLVMCLFSFLLSSVELFVASFLVSYEISRTVGSSFRYSFEPLSLLVMLALSLFISLASSYFMSSRMSRMNPLEALRK